MYVKMLFNAAVIGAKAKTVNPSPNDPPSPHAVNSARKQGTRMAQQVPLDASARADDPQYDATRHDATHEVAPDVAYKRLAIVNVVFVGPKGAGDRKWILIDAALPGSAGAITKAAAERFGPDSRPAAIVLTHGHFDHVSALETLAEQWDAPIYAHELERPYLNGTAAYPPPDTTVGGGIMPALSPLFPREPINVSRRLRDLPADGSVPHMPGWRVLPTPGHAPGHISLWRADDRMLLAGDAFVTTAQESAYAVGVQEIEMHGPPTYFTPDWVSAKSSVERLAQLEPDTAVTGHGRAMAGQQMRTALHTLARDFNRVAVPTHGQYVLHPATVERGNAYLPAKKGGDKKSKRTDTKANALARALGWFSIGLGVTEAFATHSLSDAIGMEGQPGVVRAYGWREMAAGFGILSQKKPAANALWMRVAGDVMDITTLVAAAKTNPAGRAKIQVALAAVLGVTLLDILCARQLEG